MRADSALSFHQNTRGSEELAGVFLSQRQSYIIVKTRFRSSSYLLCD